MAKFLLYMYRHLFISFIVINLCLLVQCVGSDAHNTNIVDASTPEQLRNAVSNASPGTIIEVADGDYAFDKKPLYINLEGTKDSPILLRAKNRGKARFTDEYAILLEKCSYVTIEGFTFHNRASPAFQNVATFIVGVVIPSQRNCVWNGHIGGKAGRG